MPPDAASIARYAKQQRQYGSREGCPKADADAAFCLSPGGASSTGTLTIGLSFSRAVLGPRDRLRQRVAWVRHRSCRLGNPAPSSDLPRMFGERDESPDQSSQVCTSLPRIIACSWNQEMF